MKSIYLLFVVLGFACTHKTSNKNKHENTEYHPTQSSLVILGTIQDGGSPHIGCTKPCCKNLFSNPDKTRMVVSLGLVDSQNMKSWLFEATPDMPRQLKLLKQFSKTELSDGILLTHAHIGHYAGLMYLGKEAINSNIVFVYAMPRMKAFLEQNGPWSQLVKLKNISIQEVHDSISIHLSSNVKVTPFKVPHRDEFSETVGYLIEGPNKKALFIPDIDKWTKWERDIIKEIKNVDYAFIDGTFFNENEIKSRNISEIPHPFVIESMQMFKDLQKTEKAKIYFIHFNHTNPLLNPESKESIIVLGKGFHIARFMDVFPM